MSLSPLPGLSQMSSTAACSLVDSYRKELKAADNGPADTNKANDVVELKYDSTVLSATLKPDGGFETRQESKSGVTVNVVDYTAYSYSHKNTVTSVSKDAQGVYSGSRHSDCNDSRVAATNAAITTEEAEFLFNLHEPGLKPKA